MVERLYCQKLQSVCHCCCLEMLQAPADQVGTTLQFVHATSSGVTNHIPKALLNKYMQMTAYMQVLPQDINMEMQSKFYVSSLSCGLRVMTSDAGKI